MPIGARRLRRGFSALLVSSAIAGSVYARPEALPSGARGFVDTEADAIRGMTIGPIENALFPGRGYGTPSSAQAMREARRLGATWVSITPYGRIYDLRPGGVSLNFEAPYRENRAAVSAAVAQAHAEGLRVLLVPHLWVETGGWRGEIDPGDARAWEHWATGYRRFLLEWAKVARDSHVDLLATGVELRTWVTTEHAPSFAELVRDVRAIYPGPLTYAANWDDVEDTVILGELDVIGINAFFPLHWENGASQAQLRDGGRRAAHAAAAIARAWDKPILFTEFGYTARRDCAIRPWEWPEHLGEVVRDEAAQAAAYFHLLDAMKDEPWFAGFFVWRLVADPDDVTQEAEWGFSPRGKLAELVLRDAYTTIWAGDAPRLVEPPWTRRAAQRIGMY